MLAEEAGADAIGVVMCSDSVRSVSVERAEEIFDAPGPFLTRVCVSHTTLLEDVKIMLDLHPDVIQLSMPLTLPENLPARLIRVAVPGQPIPPNADALIVDGSSGRGLLYDAEYAASLVRNSPIPVILAGGLHPGNVEEAIRRVHPAGVDVATGVEDSPGIKNEQKVRDFIRNAKGVTDD